MQVIHKFTIFDDQGLTLMEMIEKANKTCHEDLEYDKVRLDEIKFKRLWTTCDGKIVYKFEVYGEVN